MKKGYFSFYYKVFKLLSKANIIAWEGLQNLYVGGAQGGGVAGNGAMGQGTHATSFPLEAACVACTLVLLGLYVYLGQFGGPMETWGPPLAYSNKSTLR